MCRARKALAHRLTPKRRTPRRRYAARLSAYAASSPAAARCRTSSSREHWRAHSLLKAACGAAVVGVVVVSALVGVLGVRAAEELPAAEAAIAALTPPLHEMDAPLGSLATDWAAANFAWWAARTGPHTSEVKRSSERYASIDEGVSICAPLHPCWELHVPTASLVLPLLRRSVTPLPAAPLVPPLPPNSASRSTAEAVGGYKGTKRPSPIASTRRAAKA